MCGGVGLISTFIHYLWTELIGPPVHIGHKWTGDVELGLIPVVCGDHNGSGSICRTDFDDKGAREEGKLRKFFYAWLLLWSELLIFSILFSFPLQSWAHLSVELAWLLAGQGTSLPGICPRDSETREKLKKRKETARAQRSWRKRQTPKKVEGRKWPWIQRRCLGLFLCWVVLFRQTGFPLTKNSQPV